MTVRMADGGFDGDASEPSKRLPHQRSLPTACLLVSEGACCTPETEGNAPIAWASSPDERRRQVGEEPLVADCQRMPFDLTEGMAVQHRRDDGLVGSGLFPGSPQRAARQVGLVPDGVLPLRAEQCCDRWDGWLGFAHNGTQMEK